MSYVFADAVNNIAQLLYFVEKAERSMNHMSCHEISL